MMNYYHVALHVQADLTNAWSDREIARRLRRLFSDNLLYQRFLLNDPPLNYIQAKRLAKDIEIW